MYFIFRFRMMICVTIAACLVVSAHLCMAQVGSGCNAPAAEPIVFVTLPGNPFTPVVTADGCKVFVPLTREGNPDLARGVAVLRRDGGALSLERTVSLKSGGAGAVLTHDGRILVVAAGGSVAFLDAARLASGGADPVLGYLEVGDGAGAIYVNVTKGDDFLFVALERDASILVVNMAKIRAGQFTNAAIVGRIPVGRGPIAVTLSNDGKYLYTTSQVAPPAWNWPLECRPEIQDPATPKPNHARGAIVVVDVARAQTDPMHSVVARAPVGCNPVRLAISPDGATAWVTTRGDHSLVAVDVAKLLVDAEHSIVTRIRVGTAPVGVAIVDSGRKVVATNSNRFAGGADDRQSLNIVDIAGGAAHATILGTVPAGAFPRELCVSPDGRTLFVSNYSSRTLEVLDLARLAPQKEP